MKSTQTSLESSEDNCNKEMERINQDCDAKVFKTVVLFQQNGVNDAFLSNMADGIYYKRRWSLPYLPWNLQNLKPKLSYK